MRIRALSSASLSRRFALAAALLTAAAVLLIALVSFWLINQQRARASLQQEQREIAVHARTLATTLSTLSLRIADAAANPILTTALVDPVERQRYLRPFLDSLRQVHTVPLQVALTDIDGKLIASNSAQPFSSQELAWLRERIARGNDEAAILMGQPGPHLMGLEFVRPPRAAVPGGVLVYKLSLADLEPAPWISFAWDGYSMHHVAAPELRSVPVRVPPEMAALHLRLEADTRALHDALAQPSLQYAGIVAMALALAGIVYLAGSRVADRLTRDLRQLEVFSSSLGDIDEAPRHVELVGNSDVSSLAHSINRMLDRLHQQRTRLDSERQRFYQLANTIPQMAWIAEPDGTLSWFNERWYEYTGTTPADMEHHGWNKLHDPAVLPAVTRDWKAALASGKALSMTFPLRGADGRYRRFFTSFAPLRDSEGNITHWFGTNTDMTQIEQAERAVRRSEERLQQGLVAARMAVWEWTVASGALSFAANLASVFGTAFTSMEQAWALIAPDDLAPLRAAIAGALATQGDYHALVRVIRAGDGELVWLDLRGRAGSDGAGAAAMHTIAIDVSERKRAEEALRLADQRKDEFLAMLAHELRNPLAPISSAAAMLSLAYAHEPRVRQIAAIVARQAAHMSRLVDELLDVSRVTHGLVTVQRELVDLRPLASEAAEQTRPLAEARAQLIRVTQPAQPVWVRCDRIRLVQVLTNLLNNSVKYSPPGESIALSLSTESGMAVLSVRDQGAGIGAELLPQVFDLFIQGKRTLDRAGGGLGLGLPLVRKLVELHGGSVSAASAGEGRGSTFTVRLPLDVETRPGPAEPAAAGAAPPRRPLRLLVVDDNVDAADSLAMLLDVDGHHAQVAYSGSVALELAAAARFDALLLDIGMPEMDGYELARRLRAAGVPGQLVAVTGYGQDQDRALTREAGFDAHLIKPIDRAALGRLLEQLQRA